MMFFRVELAPERAPRRMCVAIYERPDRLLGRIDVPERPFDVSDTAHRWYRRYQMGGAARERALREAGQ